MKLATWIEKQGGDAKVAARFGVIPGAVYAWKRGVACPKPHTLRKLILAAQGRLQYGEVILETTRNWIKHAPGFYSKKNIMKRSKSKTHTIRGTKRKIQSKKAKKVSTPRKTSASPVVVKE